MLILSFGPFILIFISASNWSSINCVAALPELVVLWRCASEDSCDMSSVADEMLRPLLPDAIARAGWDKKLKFEVESAYYADHVSLRIISLYG